MIEKIENRILDFDDFNEKVKHENEETNIDGSPVYLNLFDVKFSDSTGILEQQVSNINIDFANGRLYFHFQENIVGGELITYSRLYEIRNTKYVFKEVAVNIIDKTGNILLGMKFNNVKMYGMTDSLPLSYANSNNILKLHADFTYDSYTKSFNKNGEKKTITKKTIKV